MNVENIKRCVTAVCSLFTSLLGILFLPVALLVACNVIDYITGLFATPSRGEKISSYKGIRGIIKKVSMWLLVVVGAIIDELIKYSIVTIGLNFPFTFPIACVVAIWLICNELISILENLDDIGTPLPRFLERIIYYIKDHTEGTVNIDNDEGE